MQATAIELASWRETQIANVDFTDLKIKERVCEKATLHTRRYCQHTTKEPIANDLDCCSWGMRSPNAGVHRSGKARQERSSAAC